MTNYDSMTNKELKSRLKELEVEKQAIVKILALRSLESGDRKHE